MTNKDELLDLVDQDDNVVGVFSRDELYARGLENVNWVRVIEVFIKNSKGQLWVPIRIPTKRIAPNGFDVGVGGHVEHGETYDEAFGKELSEEVGWDAKQLDYKILGKFGPRDGLYTISQVYEIESDEAPVLNPEDFVSAEWMYPEEILMRIKEGHPAKMNLKRLLELVYIK